MPFNVEAPMDQTGVPARYPSPDWKKEAEVRECWLPDETTIGWLVIQDDMALTWLSSVGPDRPAAYAVKEIVQDKMQICLQEGNTCREAWNRITSSTMFRGPAIVPLPQLVKLIQEGWK